MLRLDLVRRRRRPGTVTPPRPPPPPAALVTARVGSRQIQCQCKLEGPAERRAGGRGKIIWLRFTGKLAACAQSTTGRLRVRLDSNVNNAMFFLEFSGSVCPSPSGSHGANHGASGVSTRATTILFHTLRSPAVSDHWQVTVQVPGRHWHLA